MYKRKTPIELNCGLDLVREVLNGKWKIHLLYFISEGAKRPGDLQRKNSASNAQSIECSTERVRKARTDIKDNLRGVTAASGV